MALEYRAIVVEATGIILSGSWSPADYPLRYGQTDGLSDGQVLRIYDREPDPVNERDDNGALRAATAEEIDAALEAAADAEAERELSSDRKMRAMFNGLAPVFAQLRGVSVDTAKAGIRASVKAALAAEIRGA